MGKIVFFNFKTLGVISALLFVFLPLPRPAFAQEWLPFGCSELVCVRWQNNDPSTNICIEQAEVASLRGFECIFSNIVAAVLSLAGIVLFIMLLVGGFRYLTSGGDPKALEAAKGTLTHAILGLVVLLFAFFVLRLIHAITGVDVTIFRVTTN